jgi:hypothetical protein
MAAATPVRPLTMQPQPDCKDQTYGRAVAHEHATTTGRAATTMHSLLKVTPR